MKIQARELVGRDNCPQCKKHWLEIFAGIDLPPSYGGRDPIAGERGLTILELRNIHTDELCLLGPQEKYEPIVTGGSWKDWQIPKKKMPKPEKNGSMYGKPYVAPRYSGSTSEVYMDKVVVQAVKQMKRNMAAAASIPETTASIDSTTPPTAPAPTTSGSAERAVEPMLNAEVQAASPPRVVRSPSSPPPYSPFSAYGEAEIADNGGELQTGTDAISTPPDLAGAEAPPPSSPSARDDSEGGDVDDALSATPKGAGGPAQLDTTSVDVLATSEIAMAKRPTKRKRSLGEFADDEEARAVKYLKHDGVDAIEDETVAAATTADAAAWSLGGLLIVKEVSFLCHPVNRAVLEAFKIGVRMRQEAKLFDCVYYRYGCRWDHQQMVQRNEEMEGLACDETPPIYVVRTTMALRVIEKSFIDLLLDGFLMERHLHTQHNINRGLLRSSTKPNAKIRDRNRNFDLNREDGNKGAHDPALMDIQAVLQAEGAALARIQMAAPIQPSGGSIQAQNVSQAMSVAPSAQGVESQRRTSVPLPPQTAPGSRSIAGVRNSETRHQYSASNATTQVPVTRPGRTDSRNVDLSTLPTGVAHVRFVEFCRAFDRDEDFVEWLGSWTDDVNQRIPRTIQSIRPRINGSLGDGSTPFTVDELLMAVKQLESEGVVELTTSNGACFLRLAGAIAR
ncbi:hypothetical protein LTR97_007800 [Elasticomyces elasticus]|uniref:Uncharacterized protein n=1 Tax=Elasticomyces elasticus TaxID=574655 RepID=A0AAN7ZMK9_9PEZI|nr:hypothetical protein LTR97_007800 [Elasticomyces elasticus]